MESNKRYYMRRFKEELAGARRAVTPAAAERRLLLARGFADRLGLDALASAEAQPCYREWILEFE